LVEFSMTWLLVSTSPSGLITMPVPEPARLLYWSVLLTITRPGSTLFMIACWLALPVGAPLLGEAAGLGTALPPGTELGAADPELPTDEEGW
jgi:hypothetical protein